MHWHKVNGHFFIIFYTIINFFIVEIGRIQRNEVFLM